tara:strand:- start:452 stop:583 length:132 start_codon:yes stop_codon:yes gene_type:complete
LKEDPNANKDAFDLIDRTGKKWEAGLIVIDRLFQEILNTKRLS